MMTIQLVINLFCTAIQSRPTYIHTEMYKASTKQIVCTPDKSQMSYLSNFRDLLLTQCLSSTGLPKPSPSNTCPRWPPQDEQVISVLFIPIEVCKKAQLASGVMTEGLSSVPFLRTLAVHKKGSSKGKYDELTSTCLSTAPSISA